MQYFKPILRTHACTHTHTQTNLEFLQFFRFMPVVTLFNIYVLSDLLLLLPSFGNIHILLLADFGNFWQLLATFCNLYIFAIFQLLLLIFLHNFDFLYNYFHFILQMLVLYSSLWICYKQVLLKYLLVVYFYVIVSRHFTQEPNFPALREIWAFSWFHIAALSSRLNSARIFSLTPSPSAHAINICKAVIC